MLNRNIRQYLTGINRWTMIPLLLALLVGLPVLVVTLHLFVPGGEVWQHIVGNMLTSYVFNTLALMIGTGLITVLTGVLLAWLITMFTFPGRNIFAWAVILPLALPAYIAAYTYAGILGYTSPVYGFFRETLGIETRQFLFFNILSLPGAIFIFSMVLYPYVYVITRSYFLQQSATFLEASASLGNSPLRGYCQVVLPMARPAIIGGVLLVLMEVLNDYGAVRYLGVDTFSMGIFTAWFSFGDATAALKLSAYLLVVVFLLIILERSLRGKAHYDFLDTQYRPLKPKVLYGWKQWSAVAICFIPLLLGFLLPVLQLIAWLFQLEPGYWNMQFLTLVSNSFFLALGAALLCVVVSLLLVYSVRVAKIPAVKLLTRFSTLGYAIPGAVIAVGIMIPFTRADHAINNLIGASPGAGPGLILSGTLVALIFGYLVRFLAVGYNSVESGFSRISPSLEEASRSLGYSPFKTLMRVNLPLLRGSLLSAVILVFIDVLKELPLTLILRPFNFDTLATKSFVFAIDERIPESAPAALIIIATGTVAVALLNRLITKGKL